MIKARFYGSSRLPYFEGWYLKQQNGRDTVALIPAIHIDRRGGCSASLQVITNEGSYAVKYPIRQFSVQKRPAVLRLGNNIFSERGCHLFCQTPELDLKGMLRYGPMSRPAADIMGPFRFIPFMECRHSVFSLAHRVNGYIIVNGKCYYFRDGTGYMEGDCGRSFPRRYLWTQANIGGNSVMLSVADIPFGGIHFSGCIASVYLRGEEYRFATYLGAQVQALHDGQVVIRQGSDILAARLLEPAPHPLYAPRFGDMSRVIHESPSCKVQYIFKKRKNVLLNAVTSQASFEDAWNQ